MRRLLAIFLLCFASLASCGEGKENVAEVWDKIPEGKIGLYWEQLRDDESSKVQLGAAIPLRLWLRLEPELSKKHPDVVANYSGLAEGVFKAQGSGSWSEHDGKLVWTRDYVLQWFELGTQTLAELTYELDGASARTDLLDFRVSSVLPKDAEEAAEVSNALIEDVPPPALWPWILFAVFVLLLVTVFVWWKKTRRKRPPPPPVIPSIPADQVALGRLQELEQLLNEAKISSEDLVVECSKVLRGWLQYGLHITALERTTEEFLEDLGKRPKLPTSLRHLLEAFLEQCDFVKFAGQHADVSLCRSLLSSAKDFVLATREGKMDVVQEELSAMRESSGELARHE